MGSEDAIIGVKFGFSVLLRPVFVVLTFPVLYGAVSTMIGSVGRLQGTLILALVFILASTTLLIGVLGGSDYAGEVGWGGYDTLSGAFLSTLVLCIAPENWMDIMGGAQKAATENPLATLALIFCTIFGAFLFTGLMIGVLEAQQTELYKQEKDSAEVQERIKRRRGMLWVYLLLRTALRVPGYAGADHLSEDGATRRDRRAGASGKSLPVASPPEITWKITRDFLFQYCGHDRTLGLDVQQGQAELFRSDVKAVTESMLSAPRCTAGLVEELETLVSRMKAVHVRVPPVLSSMEASGFKLFLDQIECILGRQNARSIGRRLPKISHLVTGRQSGGADEDDSEEVISATHSGCGTVFAKLTSQVVDATVRVCKRMEDRASQSCHRRCRRSASTLGRSFRLVSVSVASARHLQIWNDASSGNEKEQASRRLDRQTGLTQAGASAAEAEIRRREYWVRLFGLIYTSTYLAVVLVVGTHRFPAVLPDVAAVMFWGHGLQLAIASYMVAGIRGWRFFLSDRPGDKLTPFNTPSEPYRTWANRFQVALLAGSYLLHLIGQWSTPAKCWGLGAFDPNQRFADGEGCWGDTALGIPCFRLLVLLLTVRTQFFTIVKSVRRLIGIVTVMVLAMYFAAGVGFLLFGGALINAPLDVYGEDAKLATNFGSMEQAFRTVFQVGMMGNSWHVPLFATVDSTGEVVVSVFFIALIFFLCLGVANIMIGAVLSAYDQRMQEVGEDQQFLRVEGEITARAFVRRWFLAIRLKHHVHRMIRERRAARGTAPPATQVARQSPAGADSDGRQSAVEYRGNTGTESDAPDGKEGASASNT